MKKSTDIARELVLLLGSRRALLMQLAHPLVAQAVKHHSSFRDTPLTRLLATLDFANTAVFGTEREKRNWIERVNCLHASIKGTPDDPELTACPVYSARDPHLLRWVHATLIETAVLVYETFVGPLTVEEKDCYLRESACWAIPLGIREGDISGTYAALREYAAGLINSGEIRVTPDGRELAEPILHPLPLVPKFLYRTLGLNLVTATLLPPKIREAYGLDYGEKEQALLELFAGFVRQARHWIPAAFRTNPYAWESFRQLRHRFCD